MKIIQMLIAPSGDEWQNLMFGLGDDGNVYVRVWKEDGYKWVLDMESESTDE